MPLRGLGCVPGSANVKPQMTFTRKLLSPEELRAVFGFDGYDRWVESPVVVDDLTGARLYRARQRAMNDTIDTVYFEENGNRTELYVHGSLWSWTPGDEMSRRQIRAKHERIFEALASYSSGISLRASPRRKDMALRVKLFELAGIVVYFAVVLALLSLIAVRVSE